MLRRWREEAGVAGAGGSHVTTKIRLTATVAAARRGALHLPGYTRLTKHHRYQTFLTQLQLQFQFWVGSDKSLHYQVISVIIPTYYKPAVSGGGGGDGGRPARHK